MRKFVPPILAIVLGLTLVSCGGGGGGGTTAPAPETEAPEPVATETEAEEAPSDMLEISTEPNAIQNGYTPATLSAPADTPFTIHYTNNDTGIPHNIQIFEGPEPTGKVLWAPKKNATITGVDTVTYEIPALKAGTYAFNCYVHPTMVGTLTVT